MTDVNMKELTDLYSRMCTCRECQLPKGYYPQLRPPGPKYQVCGIVFVQINPGHIGSMSSQQIATANCLQELCFWRDSTTLTGGVEKSRSNCSRLSGRQSAAGYEDICHMDTKTKNSMQNKRTYRMLVISRP
ncbi:MAG: hypothetical protein A2156_13380 [Deltaproteobacteria bacterium RBG_16_48_10]|nr:MAG: hypothetical protein A2156_13380 [Deltaproteobacteria bacterium RBG_16_48_10]